MKSRTSGPTGARITTPRPRRLQRTAPVENQLLNHRRRRAAELAQRRAARGRRSAGVRRANESDHRRGRRHGKDSRRPARRNTRRPGCSWPTASWWLPAGRTGTAHGPNRGHLLWSTWYPGNTNGVVEAFDPRTGASKWSLPLPAHAILASGGTLYLLTHAGNPSTNSQVTAVELATGREKSDVPCSRLRKHAGPGPRQRRRRDRLRERLGRLGRLGQGAGAEQQRAHRGGVDQGHPAARRGARLDAAARQLGQRGPPAGRSTAPARLRSGCGAAPS